MFHPAGPTFGELARQALSSTERGYDLLAPKFDLTPFRTPDEVLARVAEQLAEEMPCETALDLCCGTGAAMRMLRPLCRQRVVGIDRSRGMLEEARRRAMGFPGEASLEWVRGDVLQMPLAPVFDLAVCFGALGHILPRDEARFVEQVAGVLRPGGRFVFVTSEMPPITSARYLLARSFNVAMHLRNWLVSPPFIMYYLTFLLPGAQRLLERHGFQVEVRSNVFPGRLAPLRLVIARRASLPAPSGG